MNDKTNEVTRDIVAIGASAGGVPALIELVRGLPKDFRATILLVLHMSPDSPGVLPALLERVGELPAGFAVDGQRLRPGEIVVARPDYHLFVKAQRLCVRNGPKENGFRPAIDPLFRTLAAEFGPRVVGVVLSGARDDGAFGLAVIKDRGGVAIVQDPEDSVVPSMPLAALNAADVDHVLPVRDIPRVLVAVTQKPARREGTMPQQPHDRERAPTDNVSKRPEAGPGEVTPFTCPECGGVLSQLTAAHVDRYQCHLGHAFGADSLLDEKRVALEAALWNALRALKEQASLHRRLAERVRNGKLPSLAESYEGLARDADRRADVIRDALLGNGAPAPAATYGSEAPSEPT